MMANEGDEKTLAEAEKKLLEKVTSKPKLAPPVKKPDGDSALTSKDVEKIVARKLDKFEKKQADFASTVEKKHDKFQEVLNKMSENIVKLVEPSNEAEVQTANGSKELSPSGLQDVNDEDELIEDDCSDEDEEHSSCCKCMGMHTMLLLIHSGLQRLILNVQYFSKIRKILRRSLCCYKTWLQHLVI